MTRITTFHRLDRLPLLLARAVTVAAPIDTRKELTVLKPSTHVFGPALWRVAGAVVRGRLARRVTACVGGSAIGLVLAGALTPAVAQAATGCISNTSLPSGGILYSPPAANGVSDYKLSMQTDGNLVVYRLRPDGAWRPLWDTQTASPKNAGAFLAVQGNDGNLVVRKRESDGSVRVLWSAGMGVQGKVPNDRLCMQADGNLVARSTSDAPVWGTQTAVSAWGATDTRNHFEDTTQCTWYADQRFHAWTGSYVGWHGNAGDWIANAQAVHWDVGNKPRAGSIAVWAPKQLGADPTFGHVAWVTQVYPSRGLMTVTELHWNGHTTPDTRTLAYAGLRFIYVNPAKYQ